VLDTFLRALPFTLANTDADEGAQRQVTITGEAAMVWVATRDPDGDHPFEALGGYPTRAQPEAAMADALARRSHGFALDSAKLTVNQYLDHLRGSLRARTGARYTALLGDQVRPSSGGSSNRRDDARPARCRRRAGGDQPWRGRRRLRPGDRQPAGPSAFDGVPGAGPQRRSPLPGAAR